MDRIEEIFESTSTKVKVGVAILAGVAVVGAGVVAYNESQKQQLLSSPAGKEGQRTRSKRRQTATQDGSSSSTNSPTADLRSPEEANALFQKFQGVREVMIKKFEEQNHGTVPNEAFEMIHEVGLLEPTEWPDTVRLFVTQLIQDFWIMNQRVHGAAIRPDPELIDMSKQWLNFEASVPEVLIEQTNHRYSVALRSRSSREFVVLLKWLDDFTERKLSLKEEVRNNWALRKFQCACTLGIWEDVITYGRSLEKQSVNIDGEQAHPLKIFEYIALRLPNQSVNFTQVYLNAERYASKFDARLAPPFRFSEWDVLSCTTLMVGAQSTNGQRLAELREKIAGAAVKADTASKVIYAFGAMAQFPCYWVRLPSGNNAAAQPVVLTGPWNDSEMELTASFQRRAPGSASDERLIRTNLRLCLDRIEMKKVKSKTAWVWRGKFTHVEGFVDSNGPVGKSVDALMNDFDFLRDPNWTDVTSECTKQEWNVELVMNTPD